MDTNLPIRGASTPTQAQDSPAGGLDNRIEGLLATALQGGLSADAIADPTVSGEELQQPTQRTVVMRRTTTTTARVMDQRGVLEALSTSSTGLRDLVHRIRQHFQALADIEIRRILEAALTGETEAIGTPAPAVRSTRPEASLSPPAPSMERVAMPATSDGQDPDIYRGTVRLVIMADNLQRVVRFVDELCQRPQLRMLRMSGGPQQDGAEVSLSLREPLPIRNMIASMGGVVSVDAGDDREGEREVVVHLAAAMPAS